MPLLSMITDKYYEGRISPSINNFLRNPIQIISAEKALVNKGQICETLYAVLQEIFFFGSGNFLCESGLSINWTFLLKKTMAFVDPVSWNLNNEYTQIISKRKFL